MRKLFKIGVEDHEKGDVIFSWQPDGNLLATAGRNCALLQISHLCSHLHCRACLYTVVNISLH
jgi:2Fe-2S iron-sulfur cluster binding domain